MSKKSDAKLFYSDAALHLYINTTDRIQHTRNPRDEHSWDVTDASVNSANGQMAFKKKPKAKHTSDDKTKNFVRKKRMITVFSMSLMDKSICKGY